MQILAILPPTWVPIKVIDETTLPTKESYPTLSISSFDNYKLYWKTTPHPIPSNIYTHLKTTQPNPVLEPPIFLTNNYINSKHYPYNQNRLVEPNKSLESKLNSQESFSLIDPSSISIISGKREFSGVPEEKVNIGALTMREVYEKALRTLCRWLPKVFRNVTIDGCIGSISRNARYV